MLARFYIILTLVILAGLFFLWFFFREKPFNPPVKQTPISKEKKIKKKIAPPQDLNPYKIIFLSESLEPELSKLLLLIQKEKPDALFFMGNFFRKDESTRSQQPFFQMPSLEEVKQEASFKEDSLNNFLKSVHNILGSEVPIYPTFGDIKSGERSILEAFQRSFSLKNFAVIDDNQIVYTVSLGKAYFIVLATNWVGQDTGVDIPVNEWLKETLRSQEKVFPYLFVVGNQPIFSSTGAVGKYVGLDRFPKQQKQLWSILKEFHVLAYFCGKEDIYDRTNRNDVWHIISGSGNTKTTFYHYLRLLIPKDLKIPPTIEVVDDTGEVRDSFPLTPQGRSIYEFRIF